MLPTFDVHFAHGHFRVSTNGTAVIAGFSLPATLSTLIEMKDPRPAQPVATTPRISFSRSCRGGDLYLVFRFPKI